MNTEFLRTALAASALALAVAGCGRPARIGPDKAAMKAVDALYTAVGLRDEKLVDDCRARLKALRDDGRLPDAAFAPLEAIADEAREGKWGPAQDRLIEFMDGQSR